jgi:hypothetical protein
LKPGYADVMHAFQHRHVMGAKFAKAEQGAVGYDCKYMGRV